MLLSGVKNGLCLLIPERHSVCFTHSENWANIDVNMQRTILEGKDSLKLLGLSFSSTLGRGPYIESVAKATSRKIGALIRSKSYLTPEVVLYLYKSTIRS